MRVPVTLHPRIQLSLEPHTQELKAWAWKSRV